jgi:hypothetical protein
MEIRQKNTSFHQALPILNKQEIIEQYGVKKLV